MDCKVKIEALLRGKSFINDLTSETMNLLFSRNYTYYCSYINAKNEMTIILCDTLSKATHISKKLSLRDKQEIVYIRIIVGMVENLRVPRKKYKLLIDNKNMWWWK